MPAASSTSNFIRAGTLFDGYATGTLQNAQIWVNGVPANGTQAKRPRTWSVVSLVTSATVAANNFGAEDGGMYWWGDLAELIIYNQPLSDEAREQVMREFLGNLLFRRP